MVICIYGFKESKFGVENLVVFDVGFDDGLIEYCVIEWYISVKKSYKYWLRSCVVNSSYKIFMVLNIFYQKLS